MRRRVSLSVAVVLWSLSGCGGVSSDDGGGDGGTDGDFAISVAAPHIDARVPEQAMIEVSVQRNGFDGDVVLEATDLPAGVAADMVTIPAGSDSAPLVLETQGAEPGALAQVTVTGRGADLERQASFELFLVGPAGSLDVAFGDSGVAASPAALGNPIIGDILALPDGRFIVSGSDGGKVFVAAYLEDGSVDSGFGDGGVVLIDASQIGAGIPSLVGGESALQSDGKIIVAGFGFATGTQDRDVMLARLTPDGNLDSSFAGNGVVVHAFGALNVSEDALAIGPSDIIGMAATLTVVSGQDDRVAAGRFTADGGIDTAFSADGLALLDIAGRRFGNAVTFQPDGRQLVGSSGASLLLRFTAAGVLDSTFGNEGSVLLPAVPADVKVLEGGDLLVTTSTAWVRLDSGGAPVAGFGTDGTLTAPAGAPSLSDAALTADGKLIATSSDGKALARITVAGELDASFGEQGVATDGGAQGNGPRLALRTPFRLVVVRQLSQPFDFAVSQYWY